MDEQTKGFRSAVFGGFRREDVLRYIEETDAKYYEESERLRSSLDDAQTAMGELRGQNEKLTEKNAELLERLGAMTLDMDRIQAQLDEIEKGFSLQTTEIEAQNERAETLAAENDRLTSENAKLAAKCGEYDQSKDKIAEMELSAYRRAKQIEEDAKTELQKLRRQSLETIEQVRRQLEEDYPLAAVPFDDYVEKSDVLDYAQQPVTVTPARIRRMESRSIHTANGIEVKIPTELLNEESEVEFLHDADGSVSLLIKNVIL